MGKRSRRSKVSSNLVHPPPTPEGDEFVSQSLIPGSNDGDGSPLTHHAISLNNESTSAPNTASCTVEVKTSTQECDIPYCNEGDFQCGKMRDELLTPNISHYKTICRESVKINTDVSQVACETNDCDLNCNSTRSALIADSSNDVNNEEKVSSFETFQKKIAELQNQINSLLEEKRVWLQKSASPQYMAPSELRGRWLQAQNLAETYKKEKESMVIKYAQCEQKRLQLEQRVCQLELKLNHSTQNGQVKPSGQTLCKRTLPEKQTTPVDITNTNESNIISTSENSVNSSQYEEFQKHLLSARQQINNLLKNESADKSRLRTLESNLTNTQEMLEVERKKCVVQTENINRLNKLLENALKQAKETERLREHEAEWLCTKVALNETKDALGLIKSENEAHKQKIKELEQFKTNYEESQMRIQGLTKKLAKLDGLKIELDACRSRDHQMSDFTRRLTESSADMQSKQLLKLHGLESQIARLKQLESDWIKDRDRFKLLEQVMETKLSNQISSCEEMAIQIEKLRQSENQLKLELKIEKEQSAIVHKRNLVRFKDMTREIARLTQQLKNMSSEQDNLSVKSQELDSISNCTPNSPNESDNATEATSQANVSCFIRSNLVSRATSPLMFPSDDHYDDFLPNDDFDFVNAESLDKIVLIAKIQRLEKIRQSLTDQVESSQSTYHQLLEDSTKKDHVIQHLLQLISHNPVECDLNSQSSSSNAIIQSLHALSSTIDSKTDAKLFNTELYQNVQNILTNLIFKNITLKKNLSIMGEEISELTLNNQQLIRGMCHQCATTFQNTSLKSVIKSSQQQQPTFENGGMNA